MPNRYQQNNAGFIHKRQNKHQNLKYGIGYSNKLTLILSTASDDEFENLRIKGPNAVQLVKTTPLKLSPLPPIPDTIKEVIYDMLNALAAYHAPEERKTY